MAVPRYRAAEGPAVLSAGFRPFFLAAGLWACVAMAIWVPLFRGSVALPTAFDLVTWHFHELLFGFVAATIAGFLLTAVPNWTGRMPLQGGPLGILVLLWFAGRCAVAVSAWIGPSSSAILDLAFLVVFAAALGREIIAGRNWRNVPVLGALALMILANGMMHAGPFDHPEWAAAGKRLAIAVIVMLISFIGGRIIPSFTANWLRRAGAESFPASFDAFDRGTLALSAVALSIWVVVDLTMVSGAGLILAAAAHAVRLARWRGGATTREALLWILHLGYAWLPIGLALLGAAAWRPGLATGAIHALTVGAMGTMTLAVMTRASLGHSQRPLTAGAGTLAVYLLVLTAAVARIAAPLLGNGYMAALEIAAGAWIAAFALFLVLYGPLYIRRPSQGASG